MDYFALALMQAILNSPQRQFVLPTTEINKSSAQYKRVDTENSTSKTNNPQQTKLFIKTGQKDVLWTLF